MNHLIRKWEPLIYNPKTCMWLFSRTVGGKKCATIRQNLNYFLEIGFPRCVENKTKKHCFLNKFIPTHWLKII